MDNTEKKIKEAEIIEDERDNKSNDLGAEKKIDFRFELALFLILGFLLGVVIKTEAVKRVTVGYNDGQIASNKQAYDFEKIQSDINASNEAQQNPAPAAPENSTPGAQGNPAGNGQ